MRVHAKLIIIIATRKEYRFINALSTRGVRCRITNTGFFAIYIGGVALALVMRTILVHHYPDLDHATLTMVSYSFACICALGVLLRSDFSLPLVLGMSAGLASIVGQWTLFSFMPHADHFAWSVAVSALLGPPFTYIYFQGLELGYFLIYTSLRGLRYAFKKLT